MGRESRADERDLTNPYTGLFTRVGSPDPEPFDPDLPMFAGSMVPFGSRVTEDAVGGAGWRPEEARGACWGEAVERCQTFPLATDRVVDACWADWPLPEPAIPPERWVLFHPDQYALRGFGFQPFDRGTRCRWVALRDALTGRAVWAPEEMVFLWARTGVGHRLLPGISTGLSCGRRGDPVVLRGLQEGVERDALMGMWWGRYPLEEWPAAPVWTAVGTEVSERARRPNLRYRFYRVATPLSAHVTVTTLEGEDVAGSLFSAGAACRETRVDSWRKSLLESVQGLHFVRYLRRHTGLTRIDRLEQLTEFRLHALYYSLHPERLPRTPFHRAAAARADAGDGAREDLTALAARLGPERPVLVRHVTPPALARERLDFIVARVVVPGLQPMHGNHVLPLLGGPLWAPRGWREWADADPHPFP